MGTALNSKFKGSGPMKAFVAEVNKALGALNNAKVDVDSDYTGRRPTLSVRPSSDGQALVLDLTEVSFGGGSGSDELPATTGKSEYMVLQLRKLDEDGALDSNGTLGWYIDYVRLVPATEA